MEIAGQACNDGRRWGDAKDDVRKDECYLDGIMDDVCSDGCHLDCITDDVRNDGYRWDVIKNDVCRNE